MKKLLQLLIISLAFEALASAQFQVAFSLNADSDGQTAYESVAFSYAPQPGCSMCASAMHQYDATLTMTSSLGQQSQCVYFVNNPGNVSVNTGCEVQMDIDPGTDESFDAFISGKAVCTMFGTFFYVAFQAPAEILTAKSAYRVDVPTCVPISIPGFPMQSLCTHTAFGFGCPGKCTKASTVKLVIGQPLPFAQCKDVIIGGVCGAQLCVAQDNAGSCSVGN